MPRGWHGMVVPSVISIASPGFCDCIGVDVMDGQCIWLSVSSSSVSKSVAGNSASINSDSETAETLVQIGV